MVSCTKIVAYAFAGTQNEKVMNSARAVRHSASKGEMVLTVYPMRRCSDFT